MSGVEVEEERNNSTVAAAAPASPKSPNVVLLQESASFAFPSLSSPPLDIIEAYGLRLNARTTVTV